MFKKIFAILLVLLMLTGCATKNNTDKFVDTSTYTIAEINSAVKEILSLTNNLDIYSKKFVSADFLSWLSENFGNESLFKLSAKLKEGQITNEMWHSITGNTAYVLYDMYSGALDSASPNYRSDIKVIKSNSESTVIRIVGDISFADNWKIAPAIDQRGKGIYGVLSDETVNILKNADIFLCNNEFAYSKRGAPLAGKTYTFRANPNRVKLMKEIGADIVSLANNHAYDYGKEAFSDTLQTLKSAKIPYIGAGENISEAAKPCYFIVNGRKYAFTAATRAEKNILTPEAGENSSGVMRIYNPAKYIGVLQAAETECDVNIAYLHWGAENSHNIENGLYELAGSFIDAGADIVVGAHAHILQGIQYYKGVPIVYNLGNFIFNSKTIDTGILEIEISKDGQAAYKFIPAIQKECYTQIVDGTEKSRILSFMESISVNVKFDQNGYFSEKQ